VLTAQALGEDVGRPQGVVDTLSHIGELRSTRAGARDRTHAFDPAFAGLAALVFVALAMRFTLVFRLNINWDAFYFLSIVHDYLRGALASPFQTFHVHLFAWLPAVFDDEISQVLAARTVMATLATVNAVLLYGIGRRFLSPTGALFGLLAYLSFGFVVGHGASFRVDPLLVTLLLVSFHAVLRWPGGVAGAALGGLAAALATIISIKSAFHLVTIGAVYLCLLIAASERRRIVVSAGMFGLAFAGALMALFALHRLSVIAAPATGVTSFLGGSAAKMLSGQDLRLPWFYLATSYVRSLPLWALFIGGAVVARREAARARRRERAEKLIPLMLCLPILTLLFYRNAFPYYYALALAPGALLTGLAYDRLGAWSATWRKPWARRAVPAALVATLGVMQIVDYGRYHSDQLTAERQVIGVVHAAFPEPVPYLDGYGLVASFPWTGFFMSSWGMQSYRAAGQPVLAKRAADSAPVLVIADSVPLAAALLGHDRTGIADFLLFPEDERFLRENYLRYWGPLFVAGKRVALPAATGAAAFEILVPGAYRLGATVPLLIDGRETSPGAAIELTRGEHWLATSDGSAAVAVLHWADIPPPPAPAPEMCLFVIDFSSPTECALSIPQPSASDPTWDGAQP
jgi:hypothetical protein